MTEAERIARAHRAQAALDEFVGPACANLREEYFAKMASVATTELHPAIRADAITTLSVALKVVDLVCAGMNEIIKDGELASKSKARSEEISRMSDAQQRLLKIVGV